MLQNYAMMSLGLFVFTRQTIPFQTLERQQNWRHPTNSIVGGLPQAQFLGKESETISLNGRLMPEITGGVLSLKALEIMADYGASYPLIDGSTFEILGFFVIESLQQTKTALFADGAARAIDFTLQLKRTDDPKLIALAENITDKVLAYV